MTAPSEFYRPHSEADATCRQLELFPAMDTGTLSRHFRREQETLLARNSPNPAHRQAAREADRLRADSPWETVQAADFDHTRQAPAHAPPPPVPPRSAQLARPGSRRREQGTEARLLDMDQHLGEALTQPCTVRRNASSTRVEFLDRMAFVVAPPVRRIYLELRDADGQWCLARQPFPMLCPLEGGFWLDQALAPWLDHIEADFGPRAREVHWLLREALERQFRDDEAVKAVNRQIRRVIDTEPALWRIAHALRKDVALAAADNELFSRLWQELDTWEHLRERHPRLMRLYRLFRNHGGLPPGAGVTGLRAACRRRGLTRAGWRFLARFGDAVWHDSIVSNPCAGLLDEIVAYVNWQAAAGLKQPLPGLLALPLICRAPAPERSAENQPFPFDPRLAAVLKREHDRLAESQDEDALFELQEDLDEVAGWLHSGQQVPDRNQWRAGWTAIRNAYDRWLAARPDRIRWPPLIDRFQFREWVVRPLDGDMQLAREGRRMHHCIASYHRDCRKGNYRAFSVEYAASGEPLATVGLKRAGSAWRVDAARGHYNEDLAGELRPLLRRFALELQARGERLEI